MNLMRALLEKRIFRFLVTGALNTSLSYALYLALKTIIDYQIAYFLSYAAGITFAYLMSALFVFRKPVSVRAFARFPLVYIIQYVVGAGLLEFLINLVGISATFAPLYIVALTLPLTFLLSRFVLSKY